MLKFHFSYDVDWYLNISVKYLVEQDAYKLEKVEPALSDVQLDNAVKPIIQEYLEHGDTTEVEVTSCDVTIVACIFLT